MNEHILGVEELNHYVSQLLQDDWLLTSFRLHGQISGFKAYPSGHWYFTLKDEKCSVDCVMWRSSAMRMSFRPKNGDKVIMHGAVKLYEVTGKFQFYADSMRLEGIGDLYQQFEALKAKLQAEGLFDSERKRPLPARPKRIAVITSQAGAVLHDIRHVSAARDPGIPLVLIPAPVQGAGAAEKLAEAIRFTPSLPEVDVIIIGRGGGSMEDLWCFNDEMLARAIAACPIPVISAVGHETDFTICDFVADVRAATPSNAAQMAVPDRSEIIATFHTMRRRFDKAADAAVQGYQLRLTDLRSRMTVVSPALKVADLRSRSRALRLRLDHLADSSVKDLEPRLSMASIRLDNAVDSSIEKLSQRLASLKVRLDAVSPSRVLDRGYAMVTGPDGVVSSAASAPEQMTLHFHDGKVYVHREKENDHGSKEKAQL